MNSTHGPRWLATLFGFVALLPLLERLGPALRQLLQLLDDFRQQPPTPQATYAFERALQQQTQAINRCILEWLFNRTEPDDPLQNPPRVYHDGQAYRRRHKHPNTIATLFGEITGQRFLYEPLERGERSIHPLEMQLGIQAGVATPALAERVGRWAAQHPQRTVLELLRREHDVSWSCATLRTLTAHVAAGMSPHRHEAQVGRLLEWLKKAQASCGRHRPVLAVGRDGIHVPLRHGQYREGSVGTVSVLDRRGRRLGTIYLGRMPEAEQLTLSAQLTAVLEEVLRRWPGPLPRLVYLSDGGWVPTDYFRRVLRRMDHPCHPGQRLHWERILDFYHVSGYVYQLAEALFGEGSLARWWGRQMCKRLKRDRGITRVLQSAAYYHNQQELTTAQQRAYTKAYNYLRRRRRFLDYARYRRQGLPLGSGVTEAACKTVFTQRLKQSGMSWEIESGQVIVDLRAIWLSGIWSEAYQAHLRCQQLPVKGSTPGERKKKAGKAA
jgi:hypothetical protein